MNVKELIASGILESYVLGLTSTDETEEVDQMAQQHPKVQNEIATLRSALDEYSLTFEQEPPPQLRERVLKSLEGLKAEYSQFIPQSEEPVEKVPQNSQRVVPLRSGNFSWMIAASWSFLALSLLGNLLLYNRWQSSQERLTLAEAQNTTLAQRVNVQQSTYEAARQEVALLQDPATRRIELQGTPDSPNATARVFWNTNTHQVYLAAPRLPEPPSGKQYQLWAIVAGKPVDMGVFDLSTNSSRLKDVLNAQAFAISLEAQGGSTTQAGPKGPVLLLGNI